MFDGNDREWYEFRGVRYSEEIERFEYPKYLDPIFWQDRIEDIGGSALSEASVGYLCGA